MTDQAAVGPYETREQARADAGHVYDEAARHYPADSPDLTARISLRLLQTAYTTAGVEIGEYDLEVIEILAEALPEEVQAMAGLARRTMAAAETGLRAEIETLKAQIDTLETAVRRAAPIGVDLAQVRIIAEKRNGS